MTTHTIQKNYTVSSDGFEGVLYDAGNDDDRVMIVIQGLKGLDLPRRYADMFAGKGISALAMTYYGGEGQPRSVRAIPLEQFEKACAALRKYDGGRFRRIGIYGNSKGGGMALLAASAVSDISLVIAASAFAYILKGSGKAKEHPCKSMVSYHGQDLPYVDNKGLFGAFFKRCLKERNVRLLYFFDEWERRGTYENMIPVENISGDILLLTSTHDDSVPAKRDAEILTERLRQSGFGHSYLHINFESGSHNLGIFPVNNNLLRQEKRHPEKCQEAREQALRVILEAIDKWSVKDIEENKRI